MTTLRQGKPRLLDLFCAGGGAGLEGFDAIHASPPCQRFSVAVPDRSRHPDLVAPTRERLRRSGRPWIIENVPGAPVRADYLLCGTMFGLPHLIRHRLFEVSWRERVGGGQRLGPSPCRHLRGNPPMGVIGRGTTRGPWATVPHAEFTEAAKRAMGIEWKIRRDLLSEAIPPAYTAWLGGRLLARLGIEEARMVR